jgi:hypothetical protein
MMKDYTSNQFLRMLYGELFVTDIFELEHNLQQDSQLHSECEALRSVKQSLPAVMFAPKQKSIDDILRYSCGSSLV